MYSVQVAKAASQQIAKLGRELQGDYSGRPTVRRWMAANSEVKQELVGYDGGGRIAWKTLAEATTTTSTAPRQRFSYDESTGCLTSSFPTTRRSDALTPLSSTRGLSMARTRSPTFNWT